MHGDNARSRSVFLTLTALLLAACGDDKGSSTGAAGSTGPGTGADMTSAATDAPTTGASGGNGTSGGFACSPGPECTAADKSCIGLVDNAGLTSFGLRIGELQVKGPQSLASGIVGDFLTRGARLNYLTCDLAGLGTLNWLLQFDTAASTLKIGGAKRALDPTDGYAFVDEMIGPLLVAPTVYSGVKPSAGGDFATMKDDLFLPLYLDEQGSQVIVLPLRMAQVTMGTLSASQNCIGDYNDEGLDPDNDCQPDPATPAFRAGAALQGAISLEDADMVTISALQQTLCVLLSGDLDLYGEKNPQDISVCKRTNGTINFKGDWCLSTDQAADPLCADAVKFDADFAASSVKIP